MFNGETNSLGAEGRGFRMSNPIPMVPEFLCLALLNVHIIFICMYGCVKED